MTTATVMNGPMCNDTASTIRCRRIASKICQPISTAATKTVPCHVAVVAARRTSGTAPSTTPSVGIGSSRTIHSASGAFPGRCRSDAQM